jgi:hypothetical protein
VNQCKHLKFSCMCVVNRLEDTGLFVLEVRVRCSDCQTSFGFKGLPVGVNLNGATVSFDGLEARLAIYPGESVPCERN